jgi:hypothetical protein
MEVLVSSVGSGPGLCNEDLRSVQGIERVLLQDIRRAQPRIQLVSEALSPGVKREGRETDHSPPASAEVKKLWIYTAASPYVFMA